MPRLQCVCGATIAWYERECRTCGRGRAEVEWLSQRAQRHDSGIGAATNYQVILWEHLHRRWARGELD